MTHKIQISKRLTDGTILVLGADTPREFDELVAGMVSPASAQHIDKMFENFAEAGDEVQVAQTRPRMIGEIK